MGPAAVEGAAASCTSACAAASGSGCGCNGFNTALDWPCHRPAFACASACTSACASGAATAGLLQWIREGSLHSSSSTRLGSQLSSAAVPAAGLLAMARSPWQAIGAAAAAAADGSLSMSHTKGLGASSNSASLCCATWLTPLPGATSGAEGNVPSSSRCCCCCCNVANCRSGDLAAEEVPQAQSCSSCLDGEEASPAPTEPASGPWCGSSSAWACCCSTALPAAEAM